MGSLTATLFRIPDIITEYTLIFLHPLDIANFSQTCRLAHTLVYHTPDHYLWRQLFITHPFDDPRNALNYRNAFTAYDWRAELQRRIRAQLIAFNPVRRFDEQRFVLETLISVIGDASPVESNLEYRESAW